MRGPREVAYAVTVFHDGSGTFTKVSRGKLLPPDRDEVAEAICIGAHDGDETVWPHMATSQARRTYYRMANEVAKLMGWEWPT